MPLYSDHISNMYYGGSSYSSAPYSYSSSVSPLGSSYSASYLNPGGNYSSHSSLGGYSRSPLSTRWITSSGRNYSPMLSTISERGTSSPVRINSPRRVPISKRTYGTPSYTPRPININTADIDVSRDKYRHKNETVPPPAPPTPPRRQSPNTEKEYSPFMPRVDGKPETGIDSSPGDKKGTIKRGRTVVRLHTLKRKERDSPRKPIDDISSTNYTNTEKKEEEQSEIIGWREKLSDDLIYKEKREKKTIGAKLVEKFKVRDKSDSDSETSVKEPKKGEEVPAKAVSNKSPDRRCSMELLAEQACLLDSLIRGENLSTATVDLSKVGVTDNNIKSLSTTLTKRRKSNDIENPLKTTKSDHSLHDRINSLRESKDSKQYFKRRSIRKCSSSSSICRLDSITEFPKESTNIDMPVIEESRLSIKKDSVKLKTKPKPKTKITSSVEVTTPTSTLKFKVEDITVEEIPCISKKEIIYSSEVDEVPKQNEVSLEKDDNKSPQRKSKKRYNTRKKTTFLIDEESLPESENLNFWDKIGKRETVYLISRKQNLEEEKEKHRRAYFWHPEDEESMNNDDENETTERELISNSLNDCETTNDLGNNQVTEYVTIESVKPNVNLKNADFELNQELKSEEQEEKLVMSNDANDTITKLDAAKINIDVQTSAGKDCVNPEVHNMENLINNSSQDSQKVQNIPETSSNYLNKAIFDDTSNKAESKDILQNSSKLPKVMNEEKETKRAEEISTSRNKNQDKEEVKKSSKISKLVNKIKGNQEIIGNISTSENVAKDNQNNESAKKSTSENEKLKVSEKISTENISANEEQTIIEDLKTPADVILDQIIQEKHDSQDKDDEPQEKPLHFDFESDPISKESTKEIVESTNIPSEDTKIESIQSLQKDTEGEKEKAETLTVIEEKSDEKPESELIQSPVNDFIKAPSPRKPIKDEPALRPLIATPRPLQKRNPQIIHSSSSSDTSEEESSSSEDDDADDSESSEDSAEFFECENNTDGRTSTGSNDSGFDSSAPTSPAGFVHVKKGGDVPGTSNSASEQTNSIILDHELEQSTAYGLFRKTGRFTPPARSIPRFRKYAIDDFHFIKVLGKGSFGKVLLAELRDTEYYYAVKCLKKDVVLEDDDVECTLIERKVLALGTNHPYLCHLFATFQTDSHLFFVMEYLNGGDLMFHIQQSGRFPETRARFYAAEIVSGLKFLHKRGIVYRDLKLDNILLDFDGHVRIADFGMCKLQIYLEKTADTFCGTPDYMAPEIIKGLKYNQTVDWWSFGVLLYEMLIGQSPFSGCDEDELFWSICNEMPSYPRFLSQESLSILTRLLDKDARTRLGGTECMHGDVRDQDFFRPIHWDRLDRRELEAPFKPHVRHPLDTQYFDRAFTGERPRLTAVEPQVLRSMDQEQFRGFSYTNPNATDR